MDAEQRAGLVATMPLAEGLGIRCTEASADRVVLVMAHAPERTTLGGALHGGALMALADSAGAIAAFLNLPEGATGTSTIESKTNFLRGVTEGEVAATATVVHVGRRTVVVQTTVARQDGAPVSLTTQTQAVL